MNDQQPLNFSTILATSAHDMKNSLFLLLQSIETMNLADNLTAQQHQAIADLHYQTSRINGSLMQLLALYRDENKQLPIYIEENSVSDVLNDVVERNRLYLNSQNISIDIDVDDDLQGYFDLDLITYLLAEIVVNALRHAHQCVSIKAKFENEYLTIKIEDDGDGYPLHMLDINNSELYNFNANKGRSGLGLLFAKKIANEHKVKNLQGHILLENKANNSGSIFTLCLP